MQTEKLNGTMNELAELIVDYRTNTTQIKDVTNTGDLSWMEKLPNKFTDWFSFFLTYYLMVAIISFGSSILINNILGYNIELWRYGLGALFSLNILLPLLHLNSKLDKKLSLFLVKRTGVGKKNKITITDLKSKTFILYDISNICLNYEAIGDVAKQLNKIWIKNEHLSSIVYTQADIKQISYKDNKNIWNAYFYFDEIPKDGELRLEWI